MKIIFRVLAVSFLFFSLSCEKEASTLVWISRYETQCANPWDHFEGNSVKKKVTLYLSSEGIHAHDIEIEDTASDSVAFCLACHCGTGRIIHVLIEEDDMAKAEELGFSFN